MQAPNTNAIRQARQERQQVTGQITLVAPGIVVLVVLFVAIFIVPRKRSARTIRLRGPRRRHIVTRSVCAVLALAIITSVGYFSWTEAGATYAVESPQTGTVQIRTKIPVDLTAELKPNQQVTLKKGRLLIKAMVLEAVTATSFRTIRTDEFDINWIDGNSDIIENSFKLEDSAIHYRLNLTNVYLRQREGAAHNALQIEGHWMTAVSRPNGGRSSSSTGGRIIRNGIGGITNINSGNRYRSNKPLSAIPSSAAYGRLILCLFADIAEPDDKLATISTEQFITDSHEQMLAQNNQNHGGFNRRWRVDPHVPPMVSLIEHAGIAGALLAVAAVLMAQLFMRRRLATTIMLAVVILYIAALDRAALDMHISRTGSRRPY
jgi:hypothetical protein